MAEQLKEFFNGTLTSADLSGTGNDEWILIQNDATTQAVVKDAIFDSDNQPKNRFGSPAGCTLVNTNTTIGVNQSAAGNEIVEKSGVLKLKLQETPVYGDITVSRVVGSLPNRGTVINTPTLAYKGLTDALDSSIITVPADVSNYPPNKTSLGFYKKFVDAGATEVPKTLLGTFDTSTTTTPSMGNAHWLSITDTYALYHNYDGNSTTQLYSAVVTGGVVGAWSSINTTSYSYKVHHETNGKVYWVDETTVKEYDPVSQTLADIYNFGTSPTSSFTCATMCGDIFMYAVSSSITTSFRWVNVVTGEYGTATCSSGFGLSTDSGMAATYNSDRNTYTVIIGYGATYYVYEVDAQLRTATQLGNQSSKPLPNGFLNVRSFRGYTNGEFVVVNSASNPEVVKFDLTNGFTSVRILPQTAYAETMPMFVLDPGSQVTSTYTIDNTDITINCTCKVSGVEITGVV